MNAIVAQVEDASTEELALWVWEEKYRYTEPDGTSKELSMEDTHRRVCDGVYALDPEAGAKQRAFDLMKDLIWCPAGRIHAGAGTMKRVTAINCFVSPDIQDSLREPILGVPGVPILAAHDIAAATQQMGGGIGMDFSTLRPDGAIVRRTGSVSTGPLPYMGMWDGMCKTIKSSGSRRGAMMGVMICWHPDIFKFIRAKHEKGVLENFNVSVLVTDDFMKAVKNDWNWDLYFDVPRADGNHVGEFERDGKTFYVYQTVKARDLWDEIIRSTFEYAEPGVLFVDRINEMNNLWYCEYIHATNPCGEQPLPANGACNLGANNLARLVKNPFTAKATFDFEKLKEAAGVAVRFLDNVLDITQWPTPEQEAEGRAKRRIGLGVTGLGNALQMMGMVYGSPESLDFIAKVMETQRDAAYWASVELAKERGPFPAFDRDKYCQGAFIKTLPEKLQKAIYKYGIRNAVLLTIAPTGTTSAYYENVSSGLEPTIAWTYNRKAREADGTYRTFKRVSDYGYQLFKQITGYIEGDPLPPYMCSALTAPLIPVDAHLAVQAVCQKYVDASISKTINVPKEISFDEFQEVYMKAYDMGCKGCTTYRPSDVRGSVISVEEEKKPEPLASPVIVPVPRPEELEGSTYKAKYPGVAESFYVTINDYYDEFGVRRPFEVFINSKSVKHQEWISALTRMVSAIFRRGGDVTFIVEELKQVYTTQGGFFIKGEYVPSLVAMLGGVIEKHFVKIGLLAGKEQPSKFEATEVVPETINGGGAACPSCNAPTYHKIEGCGKCLSCNYSDCG